MSKKLLFLFFVFVFAVSADAQRPQYIAYLSGAQQVPPANTAATGFCKGEFANPQETQMVFQCEYSNLSGTALSLNIHDGALAGANAPVLYTFPGIISPNGSLVFGFDLTPQQAQAVKANRFYISITTTSFPNGELRGQIHPPNSAYNDFDGDSRTDLTVYRNSINTFFSLQSTDGRLREQQIGQPGDSVSLTVDFDGDGRSDFSTARYNAEVLWRIQKSRTNVLEETRWGSSSLGDIFAAADYDGDGRFDLAVFRAGVWHIIESSTGFYRDRYFGRSGDVPAPNDFDKDGKADLAVARSENGLRYWHVERSSDGQVYQLQWGLSSDAFFTGRADWDGDGAQDISVIRNESGQRAFYILRSSDQQMQLIRWGLSSDVVKLGDYDGDGRTDAAVTRAANGQRVFYILQSSTDSPRYEIFGLQGDF